MIITVQENAYLRKAEEINTYNEAHKKVLLFLLHEKKHFYKSELICFANHSEQKLEKTLKELEKNGLLKIEGALVSLQEPEKLQTLIIEELAIKMR